MRFSLLLILFFSSLGYSQTILNSESLINTDVDELYTQIKLSADWDSGNKNNFDTFNQIAIGTKMQKKLWRLIIGHEYENYEGKIRANDWSGQLRLNHYVKDKNSIYSLVQWQNNRVLQMNHRYIFGVGYRHSLYSNESQYFDLAAGLFHEDEEYPELKTNKFRFNVNCFASVKLFKNLFFNFITYFQINTEDKSDIRLFFEPKISFEQDNFSLSIVSQNRYNSTAYLLNKKNDINTKLLLTINVF